MPKILIRVPLALLLLVLTSSHAIAQSSDAGAQSAAVENQSTAESPAELFLIGHPEVVNQLKTLLAQKLQQEGSAIDQKSITNTMLAARLQSDATFRTEALKSLVEQGTLTEDDAQTLSAQFRGTTEPGTSGGVPPSSETQVGRPKSAPEPTRIVPSQSVSAARQERAQKSFDDSALNPRTVPQTNPYPSLPSARALYTQFPDDTKGLTRFGSEIFRPDVVGLTQFPMDLPAGPEYVVGPGDNLTLDIWGGVAQHLTRVVDREGRISLPEAGPVVVAGLSLAQSQKLIQAKLEPQFRNANVEVSVTRVRSVRIYVVGDVQRPGAYDISALSTPLNALYAAGGPTATGSLRVIKHMRGSRLLAEMDLYDLLLHGVRQGIEHLQPGDTILVPPVGPLVAVSGSVKRPAIYELLADTQLADVMEMAGGVSVSASMDNIKVERIEAHSKRLMLNVKLPGGPASLPLREVVGSFWVKDGDKISVSPILPYSDRTIYLQGHVYHPGSYPYRDGMQVTDLLHSYQDVLPEPATHAEVVRLQPPDFHPVTIEFNLASALAGDNTITLQQFDTVRIFGRYEIDAPKVAVYGEVLRPGEYPMSAGMTAAGLVQMAGGFNRSAYRDSASLASYVVENGQRVETEQQTLRIGAAVAGEPDVDVRLKPGDVLTVLQIPGSSLAIAAAAVAHLQCTDEALNMSLLQTPARRWSIATLAAAVTLLSVSGWAEGTFSTSATAIDQHAAASQCNVPASSEGKKLIQLLQARPELITVLKTFYVQYEAGKTLTPGTISDQVVIDRIQSDPAFARAASQWLSAMAAQAMTSLQPSQSDIGGIQEPKLEGLTQTQKGAAEDPALKDFNAALHDVPSSKPQPSAQNPRPTIVDPGGQQPPSSSSLYQEQSSLTVRNFPKFLAQDQFAFWTQPLHSDAQSLSFWIPASFGTATLIGTDTAIESHLPKSPNTVKIAANASTAGMLALVGASGGLYLMGQAQHDEHKLETGYLVGEAALDAYVASTSLQYITQRERPFTGNNKGQFFYGGNSFPSNTAAVSWAAASVLTHEYPGTLTKLLAYGIAAGVSAGRVIGEKHWASDAVIGSALGWYMGRQIYRARSQGPEIDALNWGTFEREPKSELRDPAYMGTTFMPLDSWVYPVFDRLSAMGYLPTALQAVRPWARMECARLVVEAEEQLRAPDGENSAVRAMVRDLRQEFALELANLEGAPNIGVQLESAYVRGDEIAGRALRDSYDFAQTLYDDYGRPYGQGFNAIAGGSFRAEAGPFAFYFRGEYQHGAALPNYTQTQAQAIVNANLLPFLPLSSVPTFNEANLFRPIEAYAAVNFANWEISFGYQTYDWGPARGSSLMFSNNAPTEPMLKFGRVVPFELPEPLAWLGKIRNTIFVGALPSYYWLRGSFPDGFPVYGNPYQTVDPLPYTWGDKLGLKMTENLEVGVGLSVVWAGYGRPATLHTWLHTFNTNGNNQRLDPGKRYTGINASYRLPKMRDWMTFYVDGMANDEPNPIAYPQDSAFNPGLYFARLPHIPKMDLRVEGIYTNVPGYPGTGPYYVNAHYAQGYTNYWQIIGSWIGRQGDGVQAWTTYWFTPRNKLQFGYRRQWVDKILLEGGNLNDFSTSVDWLFKHTIQLTSTVQYERWNFPLLSPGPVRNVSASVQLMFWPTHGITSGAFDRVGH